MRGILGCSDEFGNQDDVLLCLDGRICINDSSPGFNIG